jgi:hypothetical protein
VRTAASKEIDGRSPRRRSVSKTLIIESSVMLVLKLYASRSYNPEYHKASGHSEDTERVLELLAQKTELLKPMCGRDAPP